MVKHRISIMINISLITALLSSSLPAGSAQAAATIWDSHKNTLPEVTSNSFNRGPSVLDRLTTKKTLSQQEQTELTEIFGVTPRRSVTVNLSGGTKTTFYDKDNKKIDTNSNTEIQPPVQPDKNEKDIRVWIKYIKDLISYLFKKFDLQKSSTLIKSWTNA